MNTPPLNAQHTVASALFIVALTAISCTSSPDPIGDADPTNATPLQTCTALRTQERDAFVRLTASLNLFESETAPTLSKTLAASWKTLSKESRAVQTTTHACAEDLSQDQLRALNYCSTRRLQALNALTTLADAPRTHPKADLNNILWRMDSTSAWLSQTSSCAERAKRDPASFDGLGDAEEGAIASRGGVVDGGSFTLDAAGQSFDPRNVALTSSLICQRRNEDGSYIDELDCNDASLTERDRFKLSFRTNTSAYVYFYLMNSTGQFQMFFPDKAAKNRVQAGRQYFFPPGDNWVNLDDVAPVRERILLVASSHPIRELEELRGADLPPQEAGVPNEKARRVRGRIEPLITRGRIEPLITRERIEPLITRGRIEPLITRGDTKPETIDDLGTKRRVLPNVASGPNISVIEYTIRHQ